MVADRVTPESNFGGGSSWHSYSWRQTQIVFIAVSLYFVGEESFLFRKGGNSSAAALVLVDLFIAELRSFRNILSVKSFLLRNVVGNKKYWPRHIRKVNSLMQVLIMFKWRVEKGNIVARNWCVAVRHGKLSLRFGHLSLFLNRIIVRVLFINALSQVVIAHLRTIWSARIKFILVWLLSGLLFN